MRAHARNSARAHCHPAPCPPAHEHDVRARDAAVDGDFLGRRDARGAAALPARPVLRWSGVVMVDEGPSLTPGDSPTAKGAGVSQRRRFHGLARCPPSKRITRSVTKVVIQLALAVKRSLDVTEEQQVVSTSDLHTPTTRPSLSHRSS